MALTLTITDAGTGLGGSASIAGSDVASTNTLYRATWTGQSGQLTPWTSVGSRTGDGTIAISATPGRYVFRLDNLLAGVTEVAVAYQPLTDASAKSLLERVCEAARDRIRDLGLSGISSSSIVSGQWYPRALRSPTATPDPLPQIAVTPIAAEDFPGGLLATDDIGLPFAVTIVWAQNQAQTANFTQMLLWRESILSALRYQRLAGITEVNIVNPEPAAIFSLPAAHNGNLGYSTLAFRAVTRTIRG